MKYKYFIDDESRLSIEIFSGVHCLASFSESRSSLYKDKNYNKTYDTLSDFNDSVIDYAINTHNQYLDELEKLKLIGKRKVALIARTPNQYAYSTQMKKSGNQTALEFEIFSNIDSALEWLGRKEHSPRVKAIISRQKDFLKDNRK